MTTLDQRDATIVASLSFVRSVALRFARSHGQDRDECIAIAQLTLVDVASRKDEIEDFNAYLRCAVWTRMIDSTLKTHPVLGKHTHRAYKVYKAYRDAAAQFPELSLAQIAELIGETMARVQMAMALVDSTPHFFPTAGGDGAGADDDANAMTFRLRDENGMTPEEHVVLAEAREIVQDAVNALPIAERDAVLSSLDNSGAELARRRGVSRQRIGQQRQAGFKRLAQNAAIANLQVAA